MVWEKSWRERIESQEAELKSDAVGSGGGGGILLEGHNHDDKSRLSSTTSLPAYQTLCSIFYKDTCTYSL